MTEPSYLRDTVLPQLPPPLVDRGIIKWIRENLFSGVLNTFLTLAGLAAVWWLLAASLPWFLHGVWDANSLGECRSIIAAEFGEGAQGACWAMLRERWHQFIFGFYPPEAYWRVGLAFVLLFVALAPVLFTEVPRLLLWGTVIYPALGYWLLWGGSIWGPVVAMAGFGLLALVFKLLRPLLGVPVAGGLGFVAAVLWWLFAQGPVAGLLAGVMPVGLVPVESDRFGGFLLSIVIGVTSIAASLPLGILLALGRRSDMFLVKTLSVAFIEFIRGVPLITMLFTASLLLQYFLPPGTSFDLILRVDILVTIFAAAYLAEVVRGGMAALPRGQYEAADALGLDYWSAERLIILPQALKISIPSIVSTFISLFKDTTLVSFVGLLDPLKGISTIVRADMAWKGVYWEPYLFVGAVFFVLCFSMSRYSMYLERKLKTDHK
ncbi:amino acid ABC transporter permease [Rhodobacter ferrooxidans]|uniref:Polar amino acid ABC transporter, inner membrane subunit n=1 Tax=Rhodobacter ferrooxidans TaxID=371731 RepID=C8S4Y0_9RHOB|nr:amino acid ABC transporter permease [Rhodobacter sp. SW2]EEW23937.1 polar amino acid ABC transporter, inner membrane subunit [Rhodobacter sp. SW2]